MKNLIRNTFRRLNYDVNPEVTPEDSYEMALNAIKKPGEQGLVNEGSTWGDIPTPEPISGAVLVEARNWLVVLLKSGQLGYYDMVGNTYNHVYDLNNLEKNGVNCVGTQSSVNCSFKFDCDWINMDYNFWNNCSELHVVFSYNCVFYTINVDELRDPKRARWVTCSDIQTFKCECIPTVRPMTNEGGGGGGLRNGKYRFALRLLNKDGHKSNIFNLSREVFVGGDKNIPGEISQEYINIWISGLSCNYSAIELIVIKSIGSGASAEIVDRVDFGGDTFTYKYTGPSGNEIPIPLTEVLTRKVNYLSGGAVKIFDGRAFYSKIRNHLNVNMQKVANEANVGLDLYRVPAKIAHLYPSLQPGERYLPCITGMYCDGTETASGVLSDIGGELDQLVELRTDQEGTDGKGGPGDGEGKDNPPSPPGTQTGTSGPPPIKDGRDSIPNDEPAGPPGSGDGGEDGGEDGGGGTGGSGNGSITVDTSGRDVYVAYKDIPPEGGRSQEDGYYTDGAVTGTGTSVPFGKAMADGMKDITAALPEDTDEADSAGDCLECGDEAKPRGFMTGFKKAISKIFFGGFSIGNSKNRKNQKSNKVANGLKETLEKFLAEGEEEEVYQPKRMKVNVTNSKKATGGPSATIAASGDIGEQFDNINIYKVGPLAPIWVDSAARYPTTRDCSGGYLWGFLAGKNVRLLEIPLVPHFESNTVGAKSSKLLGVDETDGFVYLVGLSVTNVILPENPGKPWCESQPWKVGYRKRDSQNSRVLAHCIGIHTFEGEVNGRPHAIPKHGVNSREKLDRYIQNGGDDHNKEGQTHTRNIYTLLSPDLQLGKPTLVATHFLPQGRVTGDGWRHGMYAEATKRVGFFERAEDQKGTRETVNLHTMRFAPAAPVRVLGISKAQGDSIVPAGRGIELPLCNLSRETSVVVQLESSIGQPEDRSFIADGLEHSALVYDADAPMGFLIREMPSQYGSVVGASYVDIGLYAKKGATSVAGLVGDTFCGSFSVRRTSHISNRVGDRTFIPSPRKWNGFMRFLGFGDPTAPPEENDVRDPKNKANRYAPGGNPMTAAQAAGATGTGSVYYPAVLKCLVYFWAYSRVNTHYRQRGNEEIGEVYAGNLGKLDFDSDTPKGVPFENCWMNRWASVILRASRFHDLMRPVIRIGCLVGLIIYFIFNGWAVFGNLDFILGFWVRIVIFLIVWVLSWLVIFTVSRINRMFGLTEQLNDNEGGADVENVKGWEDVYRGYSTEYNIDSSLSTSIGLTEPYNVCVCNKCSKTSGYNNLIYYTPRQYLNTEINAFKNVLDGDYGEMQTNSSPIQTLLSMNNTLYAVTSDGWYRLSYNGDVNYRGVEYLLGNGQALGTPHRIGEGIKEGLYGSIDPNSIIIFPGGAAFVDAKADTINIFDGGAPRVISDDGVFSLMSEYLAFCAGATCRDQKTAGRFYSLGFDPELNRLLVTKRDGEGGGSWTMSYDLVEKTWRSAHSYLPNFYFWDRSRMYSVRGNEIWRHNDPKSKQIFYGEYAPFTVWFNSAKLSQTQDHATNFQARSIEIHTTARDITKGLNNRHITFNKAGWGNSYQMTGVHLLDQAYYKCQYHKDIRERKLVEDIKRDERGVWRIDELQDYIKNAESPILQQEDCSFIKEFTDNVDPVHGDGRKSVMADFYLRQMYSLDDKSLSNIELKFLRSILYGQELEG